MQITGKTSIVLMLANPVDHIRGTILINDSFEALGLDAVIAPIHILPEHLEQCLDAVRLMQNIRGLGITIPHKIAALPLMDDLTPEARRLGAVNFVRRNADGSLTGTNTDGAGFIAGLTANDVEVQNKSAMVVGVGGVGRAIAFALAQNGVSQLHLTNRDRSEAVSLANEIAEIYPHCKVAVADAQIPSELDLLVNATSLGMNAEDPLPISPEGLSARTTVAEVIVNPAITPLLAAGSARGCRIIGGAEMLKPQPRLVAQFFGLLPAN